MKYDHWLPKLLSKLPGMKIRAIVLFYTAYFYQPEEKVSERLFRHEKEHVRQQQEEGMIMFKFKYVAEFIVNLFRYRSFFDAYYNISYEIEARKAEEG